MADYGNHFPELCELLAPKIIKALKDRQFDAYFCKTGKEAVGKVLELIPKGDSVTWGGSVTLRETGIVDAVRNGEYEIIDRDATQSVEERRELERKAFFCDTYLTSVNAISEDGQFVNIDGMGNRVAAITFGPKSVIAVVGMNKICKTAEDAIARARNYASPLNAVRIGLSKTPCSATGSCSDCKSTECICSYIVTTRMSRIPGRIKFILVGESLGY